MRMQIYECEPNEQPVRERRVCVVSLILISRRPTFCGAIKSPVPAEVEADAPASVPRISGKSIIPMWLVHAAGARDYDVHFHSRHLQPEFLQAFISLFCKTTFDAALSDLEIYF